jgi:hypothetical protein
VIALSWDITWRRDLDLIGEITSQPMERLNMPPSAAIDNDPDQTGA